MALAVVLLRRAAGLAWSGLVLAGLLGAWLAALLAAAALSYRQLFVFDLLDWPAWQELRRQFLAGATLPFAFVALGAGLLAVAALGCLVLPLRLSAICLALPRPGWPAAFLDGAGWCARRMAGLGRRLRRIRAPTRDQAFARIRPPPAAAEAAPPAVATAPAAADPPAADAEPSAPAGPSGGDSLHFGRALALLEVWNDPPAAWMEEALAEELAALSAPGWSLWAGAAGDALGTVELAAVRRLLPAEAGVRQVALAVLDGVVPPSAPMPAKEDPAPGMTLSAAWLCGLLDNYALLEERRRGLADAAAFEGRWGAVHAETAERLMAAMHGMDEADWASLDLTPDRAGQVRVMTDRLRESFRGRAPAGPPAPLADPPEVRPAALSDILAAHGFALSPLPEEAGGAAAGLLARRGGSSLAVALQPLGGERWSAAEGSLGRWRSAGGRSMPSPCRAVWQRMALMRSLAGGSGVTGLVVLEGGELAGEEALAAALAGERRRSKVAIAWLDRDDRPLPSLRQFLAEPGDA